MAARRKEKRGPFKGLWGFLSAAVLAIVTIGGLVQSGELADKYIPPLRDWLSKNNVTILIVLIIILAIITIALAWYINTLQNTSQVSEHDNKVNKIVLFLSPSSGGGGNFYQEHFSHLVKSAARAANPRLNINITLVCPSKDFGIEDPELLLEVANSYPAEVAGIFMIPAYPDKDTNRDGIKGFKERFPALVLLDVYPFNNIAQLSKQIHFIGGNENEGGMLAASMAKQWLVKQNKTTCRVLILKGRSTMWEMQRINSFKVALDAKSQYEQALQTQYEESEELHYELAKASKEIEGRINRGQNLASFDLIFACNDEMAIGVLEVIQSLVFSKRIDSANVPKIIGYDGTPEMKRLIKANNPFVLGTVDVDIKEQADRAIEVMIRLLNGVKSKQSEITLLQPAIYKNSLLLP